jgi:type II secretory pathway component GspD/PulD (secretin)
MAVILFLVAVAPAQAQGITQAEFINKPVREIVMALGAMAGKTVVPDETVTGSASFFIKDKTFDQAMRLVLESTHLYAQELDGVVAVSRIRIAREPGGIISVRAVSVDLESLIRRIARELRQTVFYDSFAPTVADVNLDSDGLGSILSVLVKKLPGYAVEASDNAFYLRNTVAAAKAAPSAGNGQYVTRKNGVYSVHARGAKLSDLLANLFSLGGKEFSMLKKGEVVIERLDFDNKGFDQVLRLILEQGDADWVVSDGVYYILEINRADLIRRLEEVTVYAPRHLSVSQLAAMLPANPAGGGFKLDKSTNSIILQGSPEETGPVLAFMKAADRPPEGLSACRYELRNITVEAFLPLLPESCKSPDPVVLKSQNAVVLQLSPERDAQVRALMALVDKPRPPYTVKLNYIKAEDLLAKLPATFSRDQLSMGPDQRYLFFTGSRDQHELLLDQLRYIDMPVPQIKYQVLVVQYQDSLSSDAGFKLSRDTVAADRQFAFFGDNRNLALVGEIGKVIGLNFDIIADFGYLFASSLNASLATDKASVLLDTTLQAVSNQEVSFRNTNTFRYVQPQTDPDTGKSLTTGVTKEIVSGISLTLKGWVSGDGMITMSVSSTISKRGSGDSTTLPQTFEKVISTSVRTPSGQPIIVGGLMQHDEGRNSNTLYFHDECQNTELKIYVIPRVEAAVFFDGVLGDSLRYLYDRYTPFGQRGALP